MRILLPLLIAAAFAGAAHAQLPDPQYQAVWQEQQALDMLTRQRAVALENQVNALDARVQTQTRLQQLEDQKTSSRIVTVDPGSPAAPSAAALPSNIDAWMAQSNARVRAAAANRR